MKRSFKMAAGEDDLNDALIKQLECPVCRETCLPPINMCLSTHIVCSKCSAKVFACPTCRQPMSAERNFFAEDLCSKVKLPCKNSVDGCEEKFNLSDVEMHLRTCRFTNYKCQIYTVREGVNRTLYLHCNWMGPVHKLYTHVQNEHDFQLHESRFPLKFKRKLEYKTRPYCALLYAEGHHFWFRQERYNVKKKELQFAVLYVGQEEMVPTFRYKLEIGKKGANSLKFSSETVPVARLDESKGKLCILSEHFLNILSSNDLLAVTLTVYEANK